MVTLEKLANSIKSCRTKKGLSQSDLAEKIGVSQPAVFGWESGKKMPSASALIKMYEILDIGDELFPNNEVKKLLRDEQKKMQAQLQNLCELKKTLVDTNADVTAINEIDKLINDLENRIDKLQQKIKRSNTESTSAEKKVNQDDKLKRLERRMDNLEKLLLGKVGDENINVTGGKNAVGKVDGNVGVIG